MSARPSACLVYSTFPTPDQAEAAARALVEQGLVACANIIPGMVSVYRWQGALERATEVVVILKTAADTADAVVAAVRAAHPYAVPAILVLPVTGGDAGYLAWIAAETASGGEAPSRP